MKNICRPQVLTIFRGLWFQCHFSILSIWKTIWLSSRWALPLASTRPVSPILQDLDVLMSIRSMCVQPRSELKILYTALWGLLSPSNPFFTISPVLSGSKVLLSLLEPERRRVTGGQRRKSLTEVRHTLWDQSSTDNRGRFPPSDFGFSRLLLIGWSLPLQDGLGSRVQANWEKKRMETWGFPGSLSQNYSPLDLTLCPSASSHIELR